MATTVTPVADDIYTVVKAFIMAQLALDNAHVVKGFNNRVAQPVGPFVLMSNSQKKRLGTNSITWDMVDDDPTSIDLTQPQQMTIQLDCYGPAAGEWSDILSTLLRSEIGCDALGPVCQPLYADDPVRIPLTNAESQYEDRWKVTLTLQYNVTVSTDQQFADTLAVTLIEVDAEYPP